MKENLLFIAFMLFIGTAPAQAQASKKANAQKSDAKKTEVKKAEPVNHGQETSEEAQDRHKKFWKKVGDDQRDFWKGEHEKRVKAKEEADKESGNTDKEKRVERDRREPPPAPPKPPSPFKKKKKDSKETSEE